MDVHMHLLTNLPRDFSDNVDQLQATDLAKVDTVPGTDTTTVAVSVY